MGNLLLSLTIVMGINVMMFLGQVAVLELNPAAPVFFNFKGSMLGEFDVNKGNTAGNYSLDDSDPASRIPSATASVNPSSGNIFTDMFASIKNWLLQSTGVNYLLAILSAPYNFLKSIGLPNAFTFAVGTLWYAVSLLLLVLFVTGRDG